MDRVVLVHYGEIGVKGANRALFEKQLKGACTRALAGTGAGNVRRRPGRIEIVVPEAADGDAIVARLRCVPGIVWIAMAEPVARDLAAITERMVAVATLAGDKAFQPDSMEIARVVGKAVGDTTGRPVDLERPVSSFGVEINEDGALVFSKRVEGVGGLPVGSAGTMVALLSGGLDSPVAAWRLQRRGARIVAVHFLNETLAGGRAVETKIRDLCGVLARGQGQLKLWCIKFGDLQRQIVANVADRYRMLIYRRVMMRIADEVAFREHAGALVVGDSLGQVASQTMANLKVIHAASRGPVFTPLIGHDKTEIMAEARRIGTHDISIRPHEDCCSYLVPAKPETNARLKEIEAMETFDLEPLCNAALDACEPAAIEPAW